MFHSKLSNSFNIKLKNISKKLILIFGHIRPDGDSIGSQIALTRCCKLLGYNAQAVIVEPIPRIFKSFIQDTSFIKYDQLDIRKKYTIITVDCANLTRTGKRFNQVNNSIYMNVDHHISNLSYAKNNYIIANFSSTSEILASFMIDQNLPIDLVSARALYMGIATDTGQFKYTYMTTRIFSIIQYLVKLGINPEEIANDLYTKESLQRMQLLSNFLKTLQLEIDGKVCIGYLYDNSYKEAGAAKEDSAGFVNYTNAIKGVKIGVLLEELKGNIKGSLRAKNKKYCLNKIAAKFKGGGQECAAGFMLSGNIKSFYPELKLRLKEHLLKV